MAGNAAVAARMERAATLMRRRGLTVEAFADWRTAGRSSTMNPRAVIAHHTAAAIDVDSVLRDGRADLPGPLCNWALHRDGSWWTVASGRANHAGVGVLPSSESYGIECTGPIPVSNTGLDAFPMYDAYVLGVACICEVEGWDARVVYGHKETARPDCRKPDPAFGDPCPTPYLDMDRFRAAVQIAMNTPEEDDLTPEQAAQLDQLTKDVAALKREVVLTRPEGPTMDGTWYAWRRLNHGTEGTPPKTYSLAGLDARLARIEARIEERLPAPPPPSP